MYRSRAYRRHMNFVKAIRKRDLDKKLCHWSYLTGWVPYYDNLHQYSKNKIHCSCPDCSPRTRNKGAKRKRKNYAPSINYKNSDMKKILAMDYDEFDTLGLPLPHRKKRNW